MTLKGKVALISGAGSGIGAATAQRFAAEGAMVVMNDIDAEALEQVEEYLPGEYVRACVGDITRVEDVQDMVETALSFGGRLDILVNCAGIDPPDHDPDIFKSLKTFNRIMKVNLTGIYTMMKLVIPHMVAGGGGSVVNVASLSGIRYISGRPGYSASKGGLISLTQMAAVEYGPANIRCNVICPGAIRTPLFTTNMKPMADMMEKDVEWVFEKITQFSPMRRMGTPEEIAGICAFLAGDDASFLTGNVLVADGGASIVDVSGPAMSAAFMNPADAEDD